MSVSAPDPRSEPPAGLLDDGAVAEPLAHNAFNDATGGIWRVTGPRSDQSILKIATPPHSGGTHPHWATSDDQTHWNYWKREVLAYRSGLAASVYPGIAVPALRNVRELPGGAFALWLEAVDGTAGSGATIDQYADFATRLGAGQARWVGVAMPYPWLSRSWLRSYRAGRPPATDVRWDHPTVAAAWPAPLRDGLARLARDSETAMRTVEALPRTLAHLDVWPANLIWSNAGPVLLDWSFVGDGAVGEDIGNLVVDSVADGHVDIAALAALVDAVTDGYLAGLTGAMPANPVSADDVVRGIRAGAVAKYAWFGPRMVERIARGERVGSDFYDTGGGVREKLERWRPMLEMLVRWSDEILTG